MEAGGFLMILKSVNLLSLINAKRDLSTDTLKGYLDKMGVNIKLSEIDDVKSFVESIGEITKKKKIFNHYHVGFKINQIGKEFDLIRLGLNYNINIELKREHTGEKIHKQLKQNRYYLKALEREVYNFTYVVSNECLYFLEKDESLVEVELSSLVDLLVDQEIDEVSDINQLFDPSNYLVSPFNSTERFINGEYFLTTHQEEIKDKLVGSLSEDSNNLYSIEGGAGAGKTLLVYDIAKKIIDDGGKVVLLHCGNLNSGHRKLKDKYSWDVKPIKEYNSVIINKYDLIVIDEVQRIYKDQLEIIIEYLQNNNVPCVFSYDPNQCLHKVEIANNIPGILKGVVNETFTLTEKIRTNPEIGAFIKNLFDLSKRNPNQTYSNINIQYFSDMENAKGYIRDLKLRGWAAIDYTVSGFKWTSLDNMLVRADENAHSVIGQEFDNVIAIIGKSFEYNDKGELIGDYRSYYHPTKMLFQILTRTRKKLSIIIIDNEPILKKCLEITG
ncbi:DNA/RNA helicase domain-containing protein [Rossellomorea vietnamensis]|uniref:DNA/RNA helicase domain-containing protein n=1 Tax=Rossellomorea vietnamensis TaxID=218284 RepID=UPI003D279113